MKRASFSALVATLSLTGGLLSHATPTNGVWTLNNSGVWSAPANWADGLVADGAGATGWFTNNITVNRTITVDGANGSRTLGVMNVGDINGSHAFTFAANIDGTLTFDNAGSGAQINMLAHSHNATFNTTLPLILADSLDVNNLATVNRTLLIQRGITGAGNLRLSTANAGPITLSTHPLDFQGSISNASPGTGSVTLSGGVGSNVTAIVQDSATSQLIISTQNLLVRSAGTTVANNGGSQLTLSGGTGGRGDLVLKNNNALANGVTVSGTTVNHDGRIVNAGTGPGNTLISAIIGPNVTGVIQDSETSVLVLGTPSAANTFTSGLSVGANKTVRLDQNRFDRTATGTGDVNIHAGGTIDGNGLMGGTVILGDGGTLSPSTGDRTAGGKLMVGNLTWHGGGVLDVVVNKIAGAVEGVDYGNIVVNGNLTELPGGDNLVIRLDTLGETLDFDAEENYGLKLIGFGTAGMATNLNLEAITLDTSGFLVGGDWSLTNMFDSIYLVSVDAPPSEDVNIWIASPYVTGVDWHYWANSNNWSLGRVPLPGDNVLFDFYSTINCRLNSVNPGIGSITVAEGYVGTLDFWTGYPGQFGQTNVWVAGDVKVYGGLLRTFHGGHRITNIGDDTAVWRLALEVGGDFTLGPNASIALDGMGHRANFGPGKGVSGTSAARRSASHGGEGANNREGSATYGSITRPEALGSGANDAGGGALFLRVGGTATLDGLVTAQGIGGTATACPGSGGSIFLQAGSIAGSGTLQAGVNTTTAAYYGSGGGRIALIATNSADFSGLTIRANTHYEERDGGGRAGTVYLEQPGEKRLIIDQQNIGWATDNTTEIPGALRTFATPPAIGGDLEDVILIMTNGAFVALTRDLRLGGLAWLDGRLKLNSWTLYLQADEPAGAFPADYGAGTIDLAGLFHTFADGATLVRDGRLLWGDAPTTWRVVTLVNDNYGGNATITGQGAEGYFAHEFALEIVGSPDAGLDFLAWDGIMPDQYPASTNNPLDVLSLEKNLAFRAWFGFIPGNITHNQWAPVNGSDDWYIPYNWNLQMVPVAGQNVTIPAGTTARLTGPTPVLGTVTIEQGGTLIIDGWDNPLQAASLTVAGRITHLPQSAATTDGPNWVPDNRIWIQAHNLTVTETGSLDADHMGYRPGAGPGHAPTQPGHGDMGYGYGTGGGGGYGGRGAAVRSQIFGPAYGQPDDPWQPGSGGGYRPLSYGFNGRPGGGAIRVELTGQLTVDGLISARGQNGAGAGGTAGSGGGIALYCNTFQGAATGLIRADGGTGVSTAGSGGGGRIALHYNPAAQAALGQPRPPVRISTAPGNVMNFTDTNVNPRMGSLYIPDTTLLAASPTGAAFLDGQRFWYVRLHIGTHPASWSPASLTLQDSLIGLPEGFNLQLGGDLAFVGSLEPLTGADRAGMHLYAAAAQTLYGARLQVGRHFTIGSDTKLYTHTQGYSTAIVGVRVGRNFTVADGGGVDAYMSGYMPVPDNSNGPGAGEWGFAGGSYGGWGGSYGPERGGLRPPYGSAVMPLDPGSPGAWIPYGNYTGASAGGGVIHVLAGGDLRLDGVLNANGGRAAYHAGHAGSGGSILLTGMRVRGAGLLQARGGIPFNTAGVPGGGGRIAIWPMMPLAEAVARVAARNEKGLDYQETSPGFDGWIDTLEGVAGFEATAGTQGFYLQRRTLLMLR